MNEFDLIELIRRETALPRGDVRVGIGDDGAVLSLRDAHDLVVATDTLVAGVHFPAGTTPYDIGWKSLAVNLSDLAAMGAEPAWATLALTMPTPDPAWVAAFAGGFAALARAHDVALVGGDTTRGPLTITVTVHGFVPRGAALLRSGARVGDLVCVTGQFGDAAAALGHLDDPTLRLRLDRPVPRVGAGLALRGRATAAIDVSDGLLADLGRLCAASGVGAVLDDAPPMSDALRSICSPAGALVHAWSGGDDYELCFTLPAERLIELRSLPDKGVSIATIGRVVAARGVRVIDDRGADITPALRGYEHFA